MRRPLTLALFAWALLGPEPARAAELLPLDQVRPGMIGVGRTVFEGTRIDEFQVRVLGVQPILGRTFFATDDLLGAAPVVLISEDFWKRKFDSSPTAIGCRRTRPTGAERGTS